MTTANLPRQLMKEVRRPFQAVLDIDAASIPAANSFILVLDPATRRLLNVTSYELTEKDWNLVSPYIESLENADPLILEQLGLFQQLAQGGVERERRVRYGDQHANHDK
jgi:hypothetical protein